jgi:hypothetical protein
MCFLPRNFQHPHEADWWVLAQQHLDELVAQWAGTNSLYKDVKPCVAACQFYSDKTLLNFKGATAHPVGFTILNIAYGKRIANQRHVAYLPLVEYPASCSISPEVKALVNRSVISKCLTLLLAPLKTASERGLVLRDPWDAQQVSNISK